VVDRQISFAFKMTHENQSFAAVLSTSRSIKYRT